MKILKIVLLLSITFILESCKIYSFSGTTLSPDYKTITINNILMGTAGGPANLSQSLTEKLKEYYQRNTSLKLKSTDADLQIEGTIIGYEQTAATQTSSDKAAQNRLTIRVEFRFKNLKNENESFDREFSFFRDYNADQNLTTAEKKIVPEILDQIVLDIFNNTAANW